MQDKTFTDRTWNILTKQEPRPLLTFFRIGGGIAPRGPFKSRGKVPRTFRARKQQSSRLLNVSHVRETKTISKFNAGLRTSAVRRYKGNCGTRNRPEKFRDFWEIGPCGPFLESPEKAFLKLRLAHSVKLVFSYDVWGMKIKTAKFRALRNLYFEDTKRSMSRELRPKSFGTFEKRAPSLEKYRRTFQPRSQYLSVVFENVKSRI